MKRLAQRRHLATVITSATAVAIALSLVGCGAGDNGSQPAAGASSSAEPTSVAGATLSNSDKKTAKASSATGKSSKTAGSTAPDPPEKPKSPKARNKAVPAPSDGNIEEKVKQRKQGSVKRVQLDSEASLPDGVHLKVTKVKAFTAKAETPGEITGPALAVSIRLKNTTKKPTDVDSAIITVTKADGAPAQPTTSDPYAPFSGKILAGDAGTGTYVFLIPKKDRKELAITVEYRAGQSIAEFVGSTS